jgi:hypothetical protein
MRVALGGQMTAVVAFLLLTISTSAPTKGESSVPEPPGQICLAELKAEVLANLWKRPPARRPRRNAPVVTLSYSNDYGRPADALLLALDGVPLLLTCGVFETTDDVFSGPLAPGVHHFDAVFNFGPDRVGRSSHAFKVKGGKESSFGVTIGRDSHEHPVVRFEPTIRGVLR